MEQHGAGTDADGRASALRLIGLQKQFGETTAVDHLDLAVPRGSFFGLVGPNGAGIFGADVWADPVAAKWLIGVLPDNMALPERLTGRELLTYLGLLRGLDRATVAARAGELLEVLELAAAERTLVTDYSAGMRKKVTLATALLHTPRLLVLDEPFEAIDPVSAATIRAILQRFVDAGGSVIISSHVMTLVEQVCDHVGVIAGGRLVAAGTLDQVRDGGSLDDAFVRLVGGRISVEGLSWLAS
jgi:ABC-2 type transport system ATP-binding protein